MLSGCQGLQNVLDPASRDARLVAELSWWMFASAVFIYIVTIGLLGVGAGIFRGRNRLSFRAGTTLVVLGGVLAPIIAIVAIGFSGVAIGDETEGPDDGSAKLTVEVVGKQWWWELRYLDAAGDVVAVTANELHLPVGERARLELVSDNVIHSFWAPNLQGKTDAIPGRRNLLYAEPEVEGVWRGQCAEFCGKQHTLMGFMVIAEPREDFGAVEPSELLARSGNVFSRQEMAMLHDAGAVGEISFRFYDRDGKPVETPLNERVIGISLEDLRKADRVMALAGGESKTEAIAGALRMGIIDVLVTDKFTAARLTV